MQGMAWSTNYLNKFGKKLGEEVAELRSTLTPGTPGHVGTKEGTRQSKRGST